jgi:hypothetical protein
MGGLASPNRRRYSSVMLSRNLSLVIVLIGILANAQSVQLPHNLRAARSVFIENISGDSSVLDSVHLILASSRLGWSDERDRADLILKFDSGASEGNRSTDGNTISINIRNFYTLEVTDKNGATIWKESVEFDPSSNVRADKTEHSWIDYLHKHPAAKLVANFLKLTS